MRRALLGAATGVIAACLAQGAWAQAVQSVTAPSPTSAVAAASATVNAPPPAVQGPVSPSTATAEGTQLQEVVVTASRRREDLQKSSLAVQAISSQTLTRQGITQVQGLASLVPGLNVASTGAYTQIFLRGIGDFSATPIAEGAIAVNLDQVYLSSPAAPAGNFYDLSRVEVLRGPQGTLYGRNASGGALNVGDQQTLLRRLSRRPLLRVRRLRPEEGRGRDQHARHRHLGAESRFPGRRPRRLLHRRLRR